MKVLVFGQIGQVARELARRCPPDMQARILGRDDGRLLPRRRRPSVKSMGRGFAWLDTGTHGSLLDAGNFVRTLTERQGLQVGSPDEIAYRAGWIDRDQLLARAELFKKNGYGSLLRTLID